jgi:pimeloyl-ACP methyl ester carboxylesterase
MVCCPGRHLMLTAAGFMCQWASHVWASTSIPVHPPALSRKTVFQDPNHPDMQQLAQHHRESPTVAKGRPMLTEVVSIPTDTIALDGAYYTPAAGPAHGGVLLIHGNTMNFYTGSPRFLPPYLTALGYACLAYNRRGHDILSIRDSREPEGGAFQTAAEGLADNDYAAQFLAKRGFAAPIVIAHSGGGMLAAQFAATHPETRALALLSAHGGGRDSLPLGLWGLLAQDQLDEVVAKAERLVAAGRGRTLLQFSGWWYALSAESFLDRLRNTPETVAAAPRVRCPSLFIRGDQEDPTMYPAEEFARRASGPCRVVILDNCDHFYKGREGEVARTVVTWLRETLDT